MLFRADGVPSIARMWNFLYIAACVIVPLLWGLIVVYCSNRIDAWAKARRGPDEHGNTVNRDDAMRVEYHI